MSTAVLHDSEPLSARDEAFAGMTFPSDAGPAKEVVEGRRAMLSWLLARALSAVVGTGFGIGQKKSTFFRGRTFKAPSCDEKPYQFTSMFFFR